MAKEVIQVSSPVIRSAKQPCHIDQQRSMLIRVEPFQSLLNARSANWLALWLGLTLLKCSVRSWKQG